jgi:FAD binding domain/Berberine and berberine like
MTDRDPIPGYDKLLDDLVINRLARGLHGRLIRPGDDDYERARRVWARMVDRRPALIARCADREDVTAAIKFARECDLRVAVRSGGHSSYGTCDGGLVIDLTMMKQVEVDRTNRLARADAGLTTGELDAATSLYGMAVPLGECPTTGIGGVTLGGGIGYLLGRHGLTCDNLMAAELIDANGERLIASQADDPDLLWGLRGGGGNFGVVTSFTYRLNRISEVLAGFLAFPVGQAARVLGRVGEFAKRAPDELALILMDDRRLTVDHALCVLICWSGKLREGEDILAELRSFGSPSVDSVRSLSYFDFQRFLDAPPLEAYAAADIDFTSEIDLQAAEALAECIANAPSLGCGVTLELLHGAACRVGVRNTAFPVRKTGFFAYILAAAADESSSQQASSWVERVRAALRPVSTGDSYVNGLGMLQAPEQSRVNSAFGTNYSRLRELKRKYDPANFFRLNANIEPA